MRYLIDTQILIWYQLNSPRISSHVAAILLDVSIEEIVSVIKQDGFSVLNLETRHIANYDRIPLVHDHRDPFDRLILATALSESVTRVSADEKFRSYQSIVHLIEN